MLTIKISDELQNKLSSFAVLAGQTPEQVVLEIVEERIDHQSAYIKKISIKENTLSSDLYDGRTISVPLAWSWRLSEATCEQRDNYEIVGDGQAVHWPEIDEDISAEGMLYGSPAPKPVVVL